VGLLVDVSIGVIDVSIGIIDVSIGIIDVSIGVIDVSIGIIDVSIGVIALLALPADAPPQAAACTRQPPPSPSPLVSKGSHAREGWHKYPTV
jgi:hypothetical protein